LANSGLRCATLLGGDSRGALGSSEHRCAYAGGDVKRWLTISSEWPTQTTTPPHEAIGISVLTPDAGITLRKGSEKSLSTDLSKALSQILRNSFRF